jgi:hypothetical protein
MNRNELTVLFNKYLNRTFSEHEWKLHGNKNYKLFENELLNCDEYNNLKNNNNNKIAILISGHIRRNTILTGIQKYCNNNNYDIFVHTWDNIGIKGNETSLNDPIVKIKIINELKKYKNIKKHEIENNKNWIQSKENINNYFNLSSPEIFIKSQLYSINRSYQLMEEYSKENNIEYNVIFKFRFDCDIIKFSLSQNTIFNIKNNDILFVPNNDNNHNHMDYGTSCWACDNMYYKYNLKNVHIFEHTNIICDTFAYGNKISMKKYCELYNHYDELNNSFYELNIEQYKKHNKNIKYENGNYNLKGMAGHIDSLYYYYCSYPERLLSKYLKDYMLIESKDVKLKVIR